VYGEEPSASAEPRPGGPTRRGPTVTGGAAVGGGPDGGPAEISHRGVVVGGRAPRGPASATSLRFQVPQCGATRKDHNET